MTSCFVYRRDRFLGFHSALLYYGVLNALWLISPALAYNFSELIEAHAVDTYAQFAEQNKEALRELPAPRIARRYYEEGDLYLFDEFQTARPRSSRTGSGTHAVRHVLRDTGRRGGARGDDGGVSDGGLHDGRREKGEFIFSFAHGQLV